MYYHRFEKIFFDASCHNCNVNCHLCLVDLLFEKSVDKQKFLELNLFHNVATTLKERNNIQVKLIRELEHSKNPGIRASTSKNSRGGGGVRVE